MRWNVILVVHVDWPNWDLYNNLDFCVTCWRNQAKIIITRFSKPKRLIHKVRNAGTDDCHSPVCQVAAKHPAECWVATKYPPVYQVAAKHPVECWAATKYPLVCRAAALAYRGAERLPIFPRHRPATIRPPRCQAAVGRLSGHRSSVGVPPTRAFFVIATWAFRVGRPIINY